MKARPVIASLADAFAFLLAAVSVAGPSLLVAQDRDVIDLAAARRTINFVEEYAACEGKALAIVVLDSGGHPVASARMDGAGFASIEFARRKALTSLVTRAPSRAMQAALRNGEIEYLAIRDALPIAGGLPIESNGRLIGAIGASGAAPDLDERAASAGLRALGRAAAATPRACEHDRDR